MVGGHFTCAPSRRCEVGDDLPKPPPSLHLQIRRNRPAATVTFTPIIRHGRGNGGLPPPLLDEREHRPFAASAGFYVCFFFLTFFFRRGTAQLARSLAICSRSRRRVAACTHATPPLRTHHPLRSHGISVHATRTRSLALAAAFAPVGSETLLCGRHRFHCLALQNSTPAPTDSHSLALTAHVVLLLLGSSRTYLEQSASVGRLRVLFAATLTPRGRGYRCCAGSLGRSSKARCAEQQRRGAAAHQRCPTAVPTESLPYPAAILLSPPSSPRGRLRRAGPALLARAPLPVPSRQRTDGQLGLAEVGCG